MPITIRGTRQDRTLLRNTIADIRRLVDASPLLPAAKKRAIKAVLDDPAWTLTADLPFGGKLNGATYKRSKRVRVSLNAFAGGINRFRAVIFHELVHASCEGEFDAEVFECLLFPPDPDLPRGGTWPFGDDLDPFENDTAARADGFRESDHFVWDPRTGRVWRRRRDGSRGPIVWDDPSIWDRWKTARLVARTAPPDTREQTFVDYVEPGDYGYVALDVPVVRPPVEEALADLGDGPEADDEDDGGAAPDAFVEFVGADDDLPVSLRPRDVGRVTPDPEDPEGRTTLLFRDGLELAVALPYPEVMARLSG